MPLPFNFPPPADFEDFEGGLANAVNDVTQRGFFSSKKKRALGVPANPNTPPPTTVPTTPPIPTTPPLPPAMPETTANMPSPTNNTANLPGPMPVINPTNRYRDLTEAAQTYSQGAQASRKSVLLGILKGALQGAGSGQNPIMGAIGGAAAGGLISGFDPRGAKEQEFSQQILPQIQRRWQFEDTAVQAQRQATQDAWAAAQHKADLEKIAAESEAKRQEAGKFSREPYVRPQRPINAPGVGLYDPDAQQIIPGTAPPPKEQQPIVRRDASGNYVDVRPGATGGGPPVAGYNRPRAPQKGPKQTISNAEVLQLSQKLRVEPSRVRAGFVAKGVKVVK